MSRAYTGQSSSRSTSRPWPRLSSSASGKSPQAPASSRTAAGHSRAVLSRTSSASQRLCDRPAAFAARRARWPSRRRGRASLVPREPPVYVQVYVDRAGLRDSSARLARSLTAQRRASRASNASASRASSEGTTRSASSRGWCEESTPIDRIPARRAPSMPGGSVLDHDAAPRRQGEPPRRLEEDRRVRLAASHLVGGDDQLQVPADRRERLEHRVDVRAGGGGRQGLPPAGLSQALEPRERARQQELETPLAQEAAVGLLLGLAHALDPLRLDSRAEQVVQDLVVALAERAREVAPPSPSGRRRASVSRQAIQWWPAESIKVPSRSHSTPPASRVSRSSGEDIRTGRAGRSELHFQPNERQRRVAPGRRGDDEGSHVADGDDPGRFPLSRRRAGRGAPGALHGRRPGRDAVDPRRRPPERHRRGRCSASPSPSSRRATGTCTRRTCACRASWPTASASGRRSSRGAPGTRPTGRAWRSGSSDGNPVFAFFDPYEEVGFEVGRALLHLDRGPPQVLRRADRGRPLPERGPGRVLRAGRGLRRPQRAVQREEHGGGLRPRHRLHLRPREPTSSSASTRACATRRRPAQFDDLEDLAAIDDSGGQWTAPVVASLGVRF